MGGSKDGNCDVTYTIAAVCVLAFGLLGEPVGAQQIMPPPINDAVDIAAALRASMIEKAKESGDGPRGGVGLAGLKWGARLEDFSSMKLVENLGGTDYTTWNGIYRNGDENATLNEVSVAPVRYRFVDNLLESVSFGYQGRADWGRLKQWVEEWYGPLDSNSNVGVWDDGLKQFVREPKPEPPEMAAREDEWWGEHTVVLLAWDPKTEQGHLVIFSRALKQLFEMEDAAKNGGDC